MTAAAAGHFNVGMVSFNLFKCIFHITSKILS